MCDINIENIEKLLPSILQKVEQAEIIGFDTEFTGLSLYGKKSYTLFDNAENRYLKTKKACELYTVCQLGISLFVKSNNSDEYVVDTYNIYCKELNFGVLDPIISCQSSTIKFLLSHNFDFTTFFYKGVPFVNQCQKIMLEDILLDMSEKQFIEEVLGTSILDSVNEQIRGEQSERVILNLPFDKDSLERSLFIYYLRLNHKIVDITELGDGNGIILRKDLSRGYDVATLCNESQLPIANPATIKDFKERLLKRTLSLSSLIQKIFFEPCKIECPHFVVGHNCFIDLMLMYQKFINPLPHSLDAFKDMVYHPRHKFNDLSKPLKSPKSSHIWDGHDIVPRHSHETDVSLLTTTLVIYDTRHLLITLKEYWNSVCDTTKTGSSPLLLRSRGEHTPPRSGGSDHVRKISLAMKRPFDYHDLSECYQKFCMDRTEVEVLLQRCTSSDPNMTTNQGDSPDKSPFKAPKIVKHSTRTPRYDGNQAFPHEAGYDAFMCASLFYELRHVFGKLGKAPLLTSPSLSPVSWEASPSRIRSGDRSYGYALFRARAFTFNLTLAHVPYVDFKGRSEPPTNRPPFIIVSEQIESSVAHSSEPKPDRGPAYSISDRSADLARSVCGPKVRRSEVGNAVTQNEREVDAGDAVDEIVMLAEVNLMPGKGLESHMDLTGFSIDLESMFNTISPIARFASIAVSDQGPGPARVFVATAGPSFGKRVREALNRRRPAYLISVAGPDFHYHVARHPITARSMTGSLPRSTSIFNRRLNSGPTPNHSALFVTSAVLLITLSVSLLAKTYGPHLPWLS